MNTGITLVDVRSEAMDAIRKLKQGTMDIKTAKEIKDLLNVIVDVAKTQVEFIKAVPENIKNSMNEDSVKAIAGTLRDRDAELDETLDKIEKEKNTYK